MKNGVEDSIRYVEIDGSGKPVKIVGFCKASELQKKTSNITYDYYWDVDFCKELNIRRID